MGKNDTIFSSLLALLFPMHRGERGNMTIEDH
jgi:hypothetical protein